MNLECDLSRMRQRAFTDEDAGTKRATAVVDLGLGKVERILAFDIARAHVIADGVADDAAIGADDKSELRLGNGPVGIGADANFAPGSCGATGAAFEKQLGPFSRVDAIIEVAATGVFGFFHACAAAPVVGDAGGPYLLMADGGKNLRRIELGRGSASGKKFGQIFGQVLAGQEKIDGHSIKAVMLVIFLNDASGCGSIELQASGSSCVRSSWYMGEGVASAAW